MSVDEHERIEIAPLSHEQCDHGYCLNHGPQWDRARRSYFLSNPTFLYQRTTFLTYRHCGMPMRRVSKHDVQQCKVCGRKEEALLDELVALCTCCGYHYRVKHPAILRFIKNRKLKLMRTITPLA